MRASTLVPLCTLAGLLTLLVTAGVPGAPAPAETSVAAGDAAPRLRTQRRRDCKPLPPLTLHVEDVSAEAGGTSARLRWSVQPQLPLTGVAWRLELPAGAWADGPIEGTAAGTRGAVTSGLVTVHGLPAGAGDAAVSLHAEGRLADTPGAVGERIATGARVSRAESAAPTVRRWRDPDTGARHRAAVLPTSHRTGR